jgi:hypothetical protein
MRQKPWLEAENNQLILPTPVFTYSHAVSFFFFLGSTWPSICNCSLWVIGTQIRNRWCGAISRMSKWLITILEVTILWARSILNLGIWTSHIPSDNSSLLSTDPSVLQYPCGYIPCCVSPYRFFYFPFLLLNYDTNVTYTYGLHISVPWIH